MTTKPLDEQIKDSLFTLLRKYDVGGGGEWIGQHRGENVDLEYTDDDHVIATDLDEDWIVRKYRVQIAVKPVDIQ